VVCRWTPPARRQIGCRFDLEAQDAPAGARRFKLREKHGEAKPCAALEEDAP
jgi:hypothetical protein